MKKEKLFKNESMAKHYYAFYNTVEDSRKRMLVFAEKESMNTNNLITQEFEDYIYEFIEYASVHHLLAVDENHTRYAFMGRESDLAEMLDVLGCEYNKTLEKLAYEEDKLSFEVKPEDYLVSAVRSIEYDKDVIVFMRCNEYLAQQIDIDEWQPASFYKLTGAMSCLNEEIADSMFTVSDGVSVYEAKEDLREAGFRVDDKLERWLIQLEEKYSVIDSENEGSL